MLLFNLQVCVAVLKIIHESDSQRKLISTDRNMYKYHEYSQSNFLIAAIKPKSKNYIWLLYL